MTSKRRQSQIIMDAIIIDASWGENSSGPIPPACQRLNGTTLSVLPPSSERRATQAPPIEQPTAFSLPRLCIAAPVSL
jgi:hypothetical protein